MRARRAAEDHADQPADRSRPVAAAIHPKDPRLMSSVREQRVERHGLDGLSAKAPGRRRSDLLRHPRLRGLRHPRQDSPGGRPRLEHLAGARRPGRIRWCRLRREICPPGTASTVRSGERRHLGTGESSGRRPSGATLRLVWSKWRGDADGHGGWHRTFGAASGRSATIPFRSAAVGGIAARLSDPAGTLALEGPGGRRKGPRGSAAEDGRVRLRPRRGNWC
jgi:hypothetical protein